MQKITTPHGKTLVVIPLEEYERLVDAVDDIRDIAIADRILAAGRDEMIPAEFVNRILDGENKIRVWRDFRGLKARQLAQQADISTAYLSEIESGKKDGSISALKKIAAALKVDLDDLV